MPSSMCGTLSGMPSGRYRGYRAQCAGRYRGCRVDVIGALAELDAQDLLVLTAGGEGQERGGAGGGHCRARRAQGSCGNVAGGEGQERGGAGGVFAGGGLVQGALRRDECGGQGDGAELQEGLCRVRG
eukprot:1286669-Pyramimonas_sp.AAC.1